MKIYRIIFLITSVLFITGCVQSSALLGPAITVGTTGNTYQAALSYGTNYIIENRTGKNILEHTSLILEPPKKKNSNEEFIALVKKQVEKTRKKILIKKN